jgi:hypothetical protein
MSCSLESCKKTYRISSLCRYCGTHPYCCASCAEEDRVAHSAHCSKELYHTLAKLLFNRIAERYGSTATYEQFNRASHSPGVLQDQMEDWLEEPGSHKKMLRQIFRIKGYIWTEESYSLYQSWFRNRQDQSDIKQSMLNFAALTKSLFS